MTLFDPMRIAAPKLFFGGCLLMILGGFGLGWTVNGWRLGSDLAQERETAAIERAQAVQDTLLRLQVAQRNGDALSERLSKAEAQISSSQRKAHDAIPKVTTGRACLSGAAVRVLNGTSASEPDADLPGTTSAPAASGAERPATDPDVGAWASDADVGTWAIDVRAMYRTCAARLNALIDFQEAP